MENTHGHHPAMPTDIWVENKNGFSIEGTDPGLTKREYFAAMAMQGLCATDMLRSRELHKQLGDENLATKAIAISAVDIADALITALNK